MHRTDLGLVGGHDLSGSRTGDVPAGLCKFGLMLGPRVMTVAVFVTGDP